MVSKALTNKQQIFVDEYIITNNASKSALMAGYSANSARVTGCQLLTKPNIKAVLTAKRAELAKNNEWNVLRSQEMLLEARDRAIEQKTSSAEISAIVAINRMYGLDKDNNAHDQVQIVINPPSRPATAPVLECEAIEEEVD